MGEGTPYLVFGPLSSILCLLTFPLHDTRVRMTFLKLQVGLLVGDWVPLLWLLRAVFLSCACSPDSVTSHSAHRSSQVSSSPSMSSFPVCWFWVLFCFCCYPLFVLVWFWPSFILSYETVSCYFDSDILLPQPSKSQCYGPGTSHRTLMFLARTKHISAGCRDQRRRRIPCLAVCACVCVHVRACV